MQAFFAKLAKNSDMVVYGRTQVEKAVNAGAVEILLLSEDMDETIITKFEKIAENFKSVTEIISKDTREGFQLSAMGGYAAILRFPIN